METSRCIVCGVVIFGDEDRLPNFCTKKDDRRHVYPGGKLAKKYPGPGQDMWLLRREEQEEDLPDDD